RPRRRRTRMSMTALKLGKGSAFVKSRLLRLKQAEHTWEADFRAIPCPMGGHVHGYLGLVIGQDGQFLREAALDHEPDVNDLADLLANAMKAPHDAVACRPTVLRLRNKPEWIELLPHLGQLRIEVHLKTDLLALNQAFEEILEAADEPGHQGPGEDSEGMPIT